MIDLRDLLHHGVRVNRADPKLQVHHVPVGGCTTWRKRKVASISAPLTRGALARTIRVHELLHANHSPPPPRRSKFPPVAYNACEDARVHLQYWPRSMPRQANRDCLSVGLLQSHRLPPLAELGRADDWNGALLTGLRALAILERLGNGKHRLRVRKCLLRAFSKHVAEKLVEIVESLHRKLWCLREFTALMRQDAPDLQDRAPGTGDRSSGKATDEPMRIVRLPMREPCTTAARRTALARSGARMNRARLARAVASGSTAGLFTRTRYMPGGTWLFDASGSMDLSDARLNELCRAVPGATVAYYSGPGYADDSGCWGELVIYAESGRRAAAVDRVHGGNEVDQYAIEWLIRQPGPRYYVGDGEFCGGPAGQDSRAAVLLAKAVANRELVWHRSIADIG